MLILLKTTMAGPDGTFQAGQIVDLERGRAYGLIEGGYATQIENGGADKAAPDDDPQPEFADLSPAEMAVTAGRKAKGKR